MQNVRKNKLSIKLFKIIFYLKLITKLLNHLNTHSYYIFQVVQNKLLIVDIREFSI